MASILALAGGALINALPFSGTNFLFSKLSDHGAKERERHDRAVEQLTKDRSEWSQKHQQDLDRLYKRAQETKQADQDLAASEQLMLEYDSLLKQKFQGRLSDYYHPSDQQKNGEMAFIAAAFGLTTFLVMKYS